MLCYGVDSADGTDRPMLTHPHIHHIHCTLRGCNEYGGHLFVEYIVYGQQKEDSINFVLVFCVLVFNCYLVVFNLAPDFFNGEEVDGGWG